jgi:hypothetical protein
VFVRRSIHLPDEPTERVPLALRLDRISEGISAVRGGLGVDGTERDQLGARYIWRSPTG